MIIRPNSLVSVCFLVVSLVAGCGGGGGGASNNNGTGSGVAAGARWTIPLNEVRDGGPGRDGIPALDNPLFVPPSQTSEADLQLVVGYKTDTSLRAAPYSVMDWHEVLNDDSSSTSLVVSYCPLTGSPVAWTSAGSGDTRFGVSGLLYNSNLILFDRNTDSHWAQMLEQSVEGRRVREVPTRRPVVETTYATWVEMYPNAEILSRSTGFSRDYARYPYGAYRTNADLLFGVSHPDPRLHEKLRVLGVNVGNDQAIAYPIERFTADFEVLNELLDGVPFVVAGSSARQTAVAFASTASDGTVLDFARSPDPLPALLLDSQGTTWDIFGEAIAGPRQGEQLGLPARVQNAYWFAWATFNVDTLIWTPSN